MKKENKARKVHHHAKESEVKLNDQEYSVQKVLSEQEKSLSTRQTKYLKPPARGEQEKIRGIYNENEGVLDSSVLASIEPDKVTKFFNAPSKNFQTEHDVAEYHGFTVGSKIAAGGFATVYRATHRRTGHVAACKIIDLGKKKNELKLSSVTVMDMKNEIYIMHLINNQYIMKIFSHFVVNRNLYIFMRFANHGTLFKYVKSGGPLQEKLARRLFSQILVGIDHMHGLYIAHRDLKLENILLYIHENTEITCIISDFGLSRVVNVNEKMDWALSKTFCGTTAYMAPEILMGDDYDPFLTDVWSMGVMLFTIMNAAFPFDQSDVKLQIEQSQNRDWAFSSGSRVAKPSALCMMFIKQMMEPELVLRSRIGHLQQDPWIKKQFLEARSYDWFPKTRFHH